MYPSHDASQNPGYLHHTELNGGADAAGLRAVWLHMCIRHPETAQYLVGDEGLDPLAVDAMLREDTRSRILPRPSGVMVLLKAMHQRDGHRPEDMISLRIWIDEMRVITTREADIDAVRELRERLRAGRGPHTTTEFLSDLIDAHLAETAVEVERLEDVAGTIDTHELAGGDGGDATCGRLADLSLTIAGLQRHLAPQRAVFEGLGHLTCPFVTDQDRARWHEAQDQLLRLLESLQALQERLVIVTDQAQRIQDRRTANVGLVLSMAAAAFLPMTFVTGLLGMNVASIPLADRPWTFTAVTFGCAVFAVVALLWMRRRNWLRAPSGQKGVRSVPSQSKHRP